MMKQKQSFQPVDKSAGIGSDGIFSADQISEAAYYIYLNQGSQAGYELQHWEEAQRQLLAKQKLLQTHVIL